MRDNVRWFAALLVLACACSDDTRSGDDDEGGASQNTSGGTCRGTAWGCSQLPLRFPTDVAGCTYQAGCSWDFEFEYCGEGPPHPCDSFEDRSGCTHQVGCEWLEDGQIETSFKQGDCLGTPAECSIYTEQTPCNLQTGCIWGVGCETDYDQVSVGFGCDTWSVHDIAQDGHPAVNMYDCANHEGCHWQGDAYAGDTGTAARTGTAAASSGGPGS